MALPRLEYATTPAEVTTVRPLGNSKFRDVPNTHYLQSAFAIPREVRYLNDRPLSAR